MVFIKKKHIFLFLLFISSCAKTNYLITQGKGQWDLLHSARPNSEILGDPTVDQKLKDKIHLIEKYKQYFYQQFNEKSGGIYSKTNILKSEAVTHLVIASPYNKIEAIEEWFPFMGSFPYLGFFSEEDALKWAQKREQEGNWVYVRKVYAYSTLGHFEDPILSSFFYYDDVELAELIFHELFHTLFFAKNEVDLNESLANYFAEEMRSDYFKNDPQINKKRNEEEIASEAIMQIIVDVGQKWNQELAERGVKTKQESEEVQKRVVSTLLKPQIKAVCEKYKISECRYLELEWNNALMASMMTYERVSDAIGKKRDELNLSLPQFLSYIKDQYKEYRRSGSGMSFELFLLGENK
ncbi:MAG: hypothetical protein COW00_18510 [Bdellovibrio sp. CG12_big_fil_rev_8_21_14_0_65_39_13]|nr:MAG: hypothetical protein COW78_08450 [Bdellovibrio sp. CG22_combo_CG10-13_8_21_14_all_39_27]PIQ57874.1 MAG: hypothetical protein COW00_18510 [Bdellovibrio sp. CG12_big_fil_rev_8_21_14_0_65_39_13]PIR34543.1 MAG: hypothetical protein COV37_12585 [Bdellovibrio sp. CG11_big_fil_rev_8_21_14_0_20_39_38]